MTDHIHNFGARKRKRGASFNQTADVTLEAMGEANQHSAGRGSKGQAIVVMDSLEMGFHGQPVVESTHLSDLEEVPPSHEEAPGDIPSEQTSSRPSQAMLSQAERSRLLLPDRLLLYSYIPPHDQAPPMEEVSAPRPEGAQEIIRLWEPFNRGESSATHLEQPYPEMLWMPVEV